LFINLAELKLEHGASQNKTFKVLKSVEPPPCCNGVVVMFSLIKTFKVWNKFCLCLIFPLSGVAHANCSIEERDGGKTLYMSRGEKKIAILGWQNPTETETMRTNVGMANVIKSSAANCDDLAKTVNAVLVQQKDLNASTLDLTKRLREVPFLKTSTLGMEISDLGWKNIQRSQTQTLSLDTSIKIHTLFTQLAKTCPDYKDELFLFMRETISPMNALAVDLKKEQEIDLKTKGMDDFKLRDEYFRGTSQQSRNFNFAQQPYSQTIKEKLDALMKGARTNLETPSEASIREITEAIQDPILKGKTLDALRALQSKTRTDRARNTKIMENIMATKGNVTMAIGEEQIRGLKTEFQKYCNSKIKTTTTESDSSESHR
jgi:hypothetical protein